MKTQNELNSLKAINGILILAALVLASCSYSVSKVPTAGDTTNLTNLEEKTIGFNSVHKAIFEQYCVGCHTNGPGQAAGIDFGSYDSVKANLSDIISDLNSGDMPDNTSVNYGDWVAHKDQLLPFFAKWIAMGAPNADVALPGDVAQPPAQAPTQPPAPSSAPEANPAEPPTLPPAVSADPTPAVPVGGPVEQPTDNLPQIPAPANPTPVDQPVILPPDVTQPTPPPAPPSGDNTVAISYADVDRILIQPNCIKCHSDANPKHKISLEGIDNLRKNATNALKEIEAVKMPPKSPALPADVVATLKNWIAAGMP